MKHTRYPKKNMSCRKKKLSRYSYRWLGGSLLAAIALLCAVSLLPSTCAEGASESVDTVACYESVLICKGDSLWSIAEANMENPTNAEIRAYVDEIILLNNISSTCIHTGNYILIPKYSRT